MTIKTANVQRKKSNPKSPLLEENTKKILYPILNEASEYTLDPYWKQVFQDCSRGKFPRGCSIDNVGETIYFKKMIGNVQQMVSYKLNKTSEQIFKDLKKMFQEILILKSNRDKQKIKEEFDDICRDLQETFTGGWQNIKRKKVKDPIVRKFILELKEIYELDDKQTSELAQLLKLGFLFNWIDNDDVIYEDQKIVGIKTLHFDPDEKSFQLEEPGFFLKREYKPKVNKLSVLWEKHLEQPKNRYIL